MIYGLLFVGVSVFTWDYSKPDLGIGYPDNYFKTSFSQQEQKSRSTQIFLMESWGEIYTNTPISRIFKNKKKLDEYRFEDFKIPNGLNDYYYAFFKKTPQNTYDFRGIYLSYIQISHARLLRLYALLGSEKRNSIGAKNNLIISNRCSPDPILDALIEKITWRLGTITQINVMIYQILYFPELCHLYSLLKNKRDPFYAPFIDGNDYHTELLDNEKTDIIYSLSNHNKTKFVHFHIGNRIETAEYSNPIFFLRKLDTKGEYELPSSNTWIAVSPDGTTLITYDKDNNSLISIKDWYGKNVLKKELLNFSKNFNMRHGIFLNTTKIMLALTYRESLCNVVYDIPTEKCWRLDGSSYYFQRFLIAGESEFSGYYIVGGFSADDIRYQQAKPVSMSDDASQQFLDASHAFSMRMFRLDKVDEITFQE